MAIEFGLQMNCKMESEVFTQCQQIVRDWWKKGYNQNQVKYTFAIVGAGGGSDKNGCWSNRLKKKDQYWHIPTEMQTQTLKSCRYLLKRFISISRLDCKSIC